LWNFDAYAFTNQSTATVTGFDSQSVTIALSQYIEGMSPAYSGELILQFITGVNYGLCRYVTSAVISGNYVTLGFDSMVAVEPAIGDQFTVFGRQQLSTTIPNLPIATTTLLGGVIVGDTLTVTETGLLNVNDMMLPVYSVNGQTDGAVSLTASDIIDIAKVAITGEYTDLLNYPAPYQLMPATTTTLGGVKAPTDTGNVITVAGDGTLGFSFTPVASVNMNLPDPSTGNVTVPIPNPTGLIYPMALSANTDLNTVTTTGLYYITSTVVGTLLDIPVNLTTEATLEVVPIYTTAPGDVIQRISTATQMFFRGMTAGVWGSWQEVGTLMTVNEESILATMAGQTTFLTTGYTVGYVEVFLAGIRLEPTVDFTATDGLNIVIVNTELAAQIMVGARLTVSQYMVFPVTDAAASAELAGPDGASLVGYVSSILDTTTVAGALNELLTLPASTAIATATAGQTAFTVPGGYTPNLINVYYGPLYLVPGVDYTATDGMTVNLVDITSTVGTYLTVQNVRGIALADAVAASTLGASGGAGMIGYGTSTVAATLDAITGGTTAGMFTTLEVSDTTPSTSDTTGALTVAGGVGIVGDVYVGGTIDVAGPVTLSGMLDVTGTAEFSSDIIVEGVASVNANVTPISEQQPVTPGAMLRITNVDGMSSRISIDSYNNAGNPTSAYISRGARGTAATPMAVQDMDIIAAFGGIGFGATMFQPLTTADIRIVAEGDFTDTSQPTAIAFMTTPSDSVTKVEVARFTSMGVFEVESAIASTSTTTGSVVVTGGVGISGDIYAGGFEGPLGNFMPNTAVVTTLEATEQVTLSPTTGTVTIDPVEPGTMDNVVVGGVTPVAVTATVQTATAQVVTTGMNYQAPLTGTTVAMNDTDAVLILNPAGTLASLVVDLPPTPLNGQRVKITSTQTITIFTLNPGTAGQLIMNEPTTLTPNTTGSGLNGVEYIYYMETLTWFRL
jgi:cytoskeletal protein CcmA (bactofilin family)